MQGIEVFQVLDHGGLVQMPRKCHATDLLEDRAADPDLLQIRPLQGMATLLADHTPDHG